MTKDRSKAYRLGYPQSAKWKDITVARKADAFFDSTRIKYFRGDADGGVVVIDEDDIMSPAALLAEADKVPAVGAHNGGGFPSKYRPEFPEMMINYFDIPPFSYHELTNEKTGEVRRDKITNALPTKAGFAAQLRVSTCTLLDWSRKTNEDGSLRYPEFAEAYEIVDAFQEHILITNTLMGKYNSPFAMFVAKNRLGMKDKQDIVVEAKPYTKIDSDMSPEDAALIYKESLNQKE